MGIDGPAGAGKSTVARKLAAELGYLYVDTGAMYRALTLKALREGLDVRDPTEMERLASRTTIALHQERSSEGADVRVLLDGREVGREIRNPSVGAAVSYVSEHAGVRRIMVDKQRSLAESGGVVIEGRDICTRVVPNADVKVFLTAAFEERARRRFRELREKGYDVTLEAVEDEVRKRDEIDSTRAVDPLRPAPDSVIIDSTAMSVGEVVDEIMKLCRGKQECFTAR